MLHRAIRCPSQFILIQKFILLVIKCPSGVVISEVGNLEGYSMKPGVGYTAVTSLSQ